MSANVIALADFRRAPTTEQDRIPSPAPVCDEARLRLRLQEVAILLPIESVAAHVRLAEAQLAATSTG